MRIKRLTAGILAGVMMAANLATVSYAAEPGIQNSAGVTETSAVYEPAPSAGEVEPESDNNAPAASEEPENAAAISGSIEQHSALDQSEIEDTTETATVGTVNVSDSSFLNLRSGSGMSYDVIGHLFAGDDVEIVSENGDWYEVVVKERTGYVHKDYVVVTEQPDSIIVQAEGGGESSAALTPDGNLTLVDDYSERNEDGSGKQFITVTTKDGNYFYLVIDRDEDGNENVHFMNLVDEADLLALMDEEEAAQYTEPAEPEEPVETEPVEPVEPEEPVEEPEPDSGANMLPVVILLLAVIGGGGFFAYTKLKGKQKAQEQEKPDPDADYLDGEEEMDFDLPDDFENEEDDSTMYDAEDNEPV